MSSPRCSVTANPVPSAVCLKMLPISASAAAARSERGTGTGTGRSAPVRWQGRRWSSASADQNSKRSARTLAASQPAGSSGPGRRAALMIRSTCCSSRSMAVLVSSAAGPGPSAAAFIRSAVSGVRSRCGRSADITRSAVMRPLSRSAITLNAWPAAASSAGPRTVLRAVRSPSPSSAAACASSRAGRVTRDARRSATTTETAIRASATAVIAAHDAATPRETSAAGTKTSVTASRPPPSATGWRTAYPPGTGAMKDLAAVVAMRRSAALARCGPPTNVPGWLAGPPETACAPPPPSAGGAVR
jgi:hypothetical protein